MKLDEDIVTDPASPARDNTYRNSPQNNASSGYSMCENARASHYLHHKPYRLIKTTQSKHYGDSGLIHKLNDNYSRKSVRVINIDKP